MKFLGYVFVVLVLVAVGYCVCRFGLIDGVLALFNK